jgi:hypothetical protein
MLLLLYYFIAECPYENEDKRFFDSQNLSATMVRCAICACQLGWLYIECEQLIRNGLDYFKDGWNYL